MRCRLGKLISVRRQRSNAGYTMPEFCVALFVFFFFVVFPMLNLIAFGCAAATDYLIARQCAGGAAATGNYALALAAVQKQASALTGSGLAKWVRMQPVGGYNNCGVTLYVDATNYIGNTVKSYGPNTPVPPPIDTTSTFYEYRAVASYDVRPFIDLGSVPFINNVPVIGKPAQLNFTCLRQVEYPQGLEGAGSLASIGNLPGAPGNGSNPSNPLASPPPADWNYPILGYGVTVPIPGNPNGSYLLTFNGTTYMNGSNIEFSNFTWQGQVISQTNNSITTGNQTFNTGSQSGSATSPITNPVTDIASYDHGDMNWSDIQMQLQQYQQLANPSSVSPGQYIYWDPATGSITNTGTDPNLWNPQGLSSAQAAALAQGMQDLMAWMVANGIAQHVAGY